FAGKVYVLPAPLAAGMQYPGVEAAVTPRLAVIAGDPVERIVAHEAPLDAGLQRCSDTEGNRPGRLHVTAGGDGSQFRRRGQQRGGLWRRHSDDDLAEGAVAGTCGIHQRPEFLAAEYLGDAATERDGQVIEQTLRDRAHGRRADPAQLFIRRGGQLAVTGLEQAG